MPFVGQARGMTASAEQQARGLSKLPRTSTLVDPVRLTRPR